MTIQANNLILIWNIPNRNCHLRHAVINMNLVNLVLIMIIHWNWIFAVCSECSYIKFSWSNDSTLIHFILLCCPWAASLRARRAWRQCPAVFPFYGSAVGCRGVQKENRITTGIVYSLVKNSVHWISFYSQTPVGQPPSHVLLILLEM